MTFDVKQMKPGWSLSKLKAFACPLRGARLYIEQRKEPRADKFIVGSLVAVCMAEVRLRWMESGADVRHSGHVERTIDAAAATEGGSEAQRREAAETVYEALNHMGGLLPDRSPVARYWIEERLAFTKAWERLQFAERDKAWWGSKDQRARTWFRCVPDFAWLDRDGTLHVEDDKTGFAKWSTTQVHAYAFALGKLLGPKDAPETILCRYNMLSERRFDAAPMATPAEVSGFPSWLAAEAGKIEALTDFPPVLGRHCDWCGFVAECPAHEATRHELTTRDPEGFGAIATREQAEAGGLWLLAAERCVRAAKERLRAYVEEHGTVALPGTGQELRLNPVTEFEVGAIPALNEIGAALVAQGLTVDEARKAVLSAVSLRWSQVEGATKRLWPYSGKGVYAEAKAAAKAIRGPVESRIRAAGTETPRTPQFGVYAQKEAA